RLIKAIADMVYFPTSDSCISTVTNKKSRYKMAEFHSSSWLLILIMTPNPYAVMISSYPMPGYPPPTSR
ncbi:MAG: hypothetical protein ACYTXE_38125, partial [Nostoc sp.]